MKNRIKDLLFDAAIVLLGTVILLLCMELGFRARERLAVENALAVDNSDAARHIINWDAISVPLDDRPSSEAYRGIEWAKDYVREVRTHPSPGLAYEPFSLWRHKEYSNKYVTYHNGYRRTVPERTTGCQKPRKIFFLGGSTVAGDGVVRDEDTIPSLFAQQAEKERICVEVKSFAESGFNQGNEFVLLTSLLAAGEIPDDVIFYDGVNDATHRIAYGVPHMAFDFFSKVTDFRELERPRLRDVLAGWLRVYFATARFFIPAKAQEAPLERLETDKATIHERAAGVASDFRGRMDLLRRLGDSYGFHVSLVLQPTLFQKPVRSAEEQALLDATNRLVPTMGASVDSLYGAVRETFAKQDPCHCLIDLSAAFEATRESLFVDYAHVSPTGNRIVADEIFRSLRKRNVLR